MVRTMVARACTVAVTGMAFFLGAFYLLPYTVFAELCPMSLWAVFRTGSDSRGLSGVIAILSLLVVAALWRKVAKQRDALVVLACLGLYVVGLSSTILLFRQDLVAANNSLLVLTSLTAGLLSALLTRRAEAVLRLLCTLGAIQALYSLWLFKQGVNVIQSGTVLRMGGTFGNPGELYTLEMVALTASMVFAVRSKQPLAMGLWVVCSAVVLSALLMTWYRGGILGAGAAVCAVSYKLTSDKRSFVAAAAVALAVIAVVFFVRVSGGANAASSSRSIYGREAAWSRAFHIFLNNPVTGIGTGAMEIPVVQKVQRSGGPRQEVLLEPRNIYLQFLGELGIAGGLLLVGWFWGVRNLVQRSSNASVALLGIWVCLAVSGLTDTIAGVSVRPAGNFILGSVIVATLFLANEDAVEPQGRNTRRRLSGAALLGVPT